MFDFSFMLRAKSHNTLQKITWELAKNELVHKEAAYLKIICRFQDQPERFARFCSYDMREMFPESRFLVW